MMTDYKAGVIYSIFPPVATAKHDAIGSLIGEN
jgi:hypothetical protein